ncbi:uncharacterized protein [Chlorocebus sabaeus]|uniref:uncharacterized protein isoform X2 n=1 Tax=Chlorocebus sabaeus TaxID=60711 RepID=UPI003BFA31CA
MTSDSGGPASRASETGSTASCGGRWRTCCSTAALPTAARSTSLRTGRSTSSCARAARVSSVTEAKPSLLTLNPTLIDCCFSGLTAADLMKYKPKCVVTTDLLAQNSCREEQGGEEHGGIQNLDRRTT